MKITHYIHRIQPVNKINYTHNHKPKEQPKLSKINSKPTQSFASILQQVKSKL